MLDKNFCLENSYDTNDMADIYGNHSPCKSVELNGDRVSLVKYSITVKKPEIVFVSQNNELSECLQSLVCHYKSNLNSPK